MQNQIALNFTTSRLESEQSNLSDSFYCAQKPANLAPWGKTAVRAIKHFIAHLSAGIFSSRPCDPLKNLLIWEEALCGGALPHVVDEGLFQVLFAAQHLVVSAGSWFKSQRLQQPHPGHHHIHTGVHPDRRKTKAWWEGLLNTCTRSDLLRERTNLAWTIVQVWTKHSLLYLLEQKSKETNV